MNQQILRVLVVEDSEDDAELMLHQLRKGGYEPKFLRVETPRDLGNALDSQEWDVVITDFVIPGFGGLDALRLYKQKGLDVPFIVLSGQIGEDLAVRLMKAGAHDCIMKDNLARLVPAVTRELRDAAVRRDRRDAENALRESEERFRQLAENIDSAFFMFERASDGSCCRLLYASDAYEKIWGRSRESLYKDGRSWLKAVHPQDLPSVRKNLPMMERGEFNQEFRIIGLDMKVHWVHYRTFPVFNTMGAVYRVAGIAEDVSDRKAAEEQLADKQRQLGMMVEELKSIDEQLKESNEAVWQTRKELERRVHERTAGLVCANAELQSQILARTQLEGELIEMADRERRRRGMDTHAKLSQKLMGISYMLKALERKILNKHLPRIKETRRIQNLINEVINHSDDLTQDLGSLELHGDDLTRELKTLAAKLRKTFRISSQCSAKGPAPKLSHHAASQLYKIAQDAAANAIKHGSATSISFSLISESNSFRLVINDNGLPFLAGRDPKDEMYWRIMRSRANLIGGSLQIEPQEGQGMIVTCTLANPAANETWLPSANGNGEAIESIAQSC